MAEWSKALRSGRSLFGGVGSNPTGCTPHTHTHTHTHTPRPWFSGENTSLPTRWPGFDSRRTHEQSRLFAPPRGACGVMASTRDSESLNPGSNPGRPFALGPAPPRRGAALTVAQLEERGTVMCPKGVVIPRSLVRIRPVRERERERDTHTAFCAKTQPTRRHLRDSNPRGQSPTA